MYPYQIKSTAKIRVAKPIQDKLVLSLHKYLDYVQYLCSQINKNTDLRKNETAS